MSEQDFIYLNLSAGQKYIYALASIARAEAGKKMQTENKQQT